jgi:hypothetical protein
VGLGSVDEIGEGGDPDMTISVRAIVEFPRRFITASGGSLDRSESAMAATPVSGDSVRRRPHPGEMHSRMKTIHPIRTDGDR